MPVVGTKLHLPTPRRRLVPRRRLTDRLDTADKPRLVLVAAPAGFGKTTLLTQWLTAWADGRAENRVAWLALDPGDADVRRFLGHLIAAVQTVVPEVGADALVRLEGAEAFEPDAVVAGLVNDLDLMAGPTMLALDDYHVIDDPGVHDVVRQLLEHLPPHVTLAMTTRADPPLSLPRLRARGELVEIRGGDLRFTPEEAEGFLNDVMQLGLPADLVAALETRTEGWAVGLQLAALSARDRGDGEVAGFVEAFSGSHRFVLDYLVEEVLDRQPDDVRSFLLATAVLAQLRGDLCDALTGRADGADVLEALERDNLFVVPLDDARRWYRYHHLFADVLRARLSARSPDTVVALHAAATRWYADHGLIADAWHHAIAGGDHQRAADLFELATPDLRRRRDSHTLRAWLLTLPEEVVRRRPLLAVQMVWLRLSEGDLGGMPAWLDAVEQGLAASGPPVAAPPALAEAARDRTAEVGALPAIVAMYRASVGQALGDRAATVAHARAAIALAGPDDHFPRAAGAAFLGMTAWADGDLRAGVEAFTAGRGRVGRGGHGGRPARHDRGAREPVARTGPTRRGAPALRASHRRGRRHSRDSPPPGTSTSAWRTCCASRATSTGRLATWRWRGPSATVRRSRRTGTGGSRPRPVCCARRATSTGPSRCSTEQSRSCDPASSPTYARSPPAGRGSSWRRAGWPKRPTGPGAGA